MLKMHLGKAVSYKLPTGKAVFNETNEQVSWTMWTWNPVTGCLRDCPFGCYASKMANKPSYKHAWLASHRCFIMSGSTRQLILRCPSIK
jgi:hypothetical protein